MSVAVAALFALSACSKQESEAAVLSEAEEAYNASDYQRAQELTDKIMDKSDLNTMSVNDLCRLSFLLMHLADNSGTEANIASAARTLMKAMEINPDSTQAYLQEVAVDDRAAMAIIIALSEAHNNPVSPDSLYSHEHEIPDNE